MRLYFAYGGNRDVAAMAQRCRGGQDRARPGHPRLRSRRALGFGLDGVGLIRLPDLHNVVDGRDKPGHDGTRAPALSPRGGD